MTTSPDQLSAPLSPREVAQVRAQLARLTSVHELDLAQVADLLGEPQAAVELYASGHAAPARAVAAAVEALALRMAHGSLAAWKRRVAASSGYELLVDRTLTILAVNGAAPGLARRTTQGVLDPSLFIGRKYNAILPSLDCALIETHGNGIDDLIAIGFFDGKIRCVRFCAEMNIGTLVRTGVREFWPVETADAGIVAHCILHDRNGVAPLLTRPGIHVHWREIVRAGADDFE
jgi:predicted transcriptional regulator